MFWWHLSEQKKSFYMRLANIGDAFWITPRTRIAFYRKLSRSPTRIVNRISFISMVQCEKYMCSPTWPILQMNALNTCIWIEVVFPYISWTYTQARNKNGLFGNYFATIVMYFQRHTLTLYIQIQLLPQISTFLGTFPER